MASSLVTCSTRSTSDKIQILRHESRADALDLVRRRRQRLAGQRLGDDRRMRGFDRHRQNLLAARLLDVARNAGQRAAGADAADEDIHLAVGVVPNLGPGGLFVNRGIGRIFELLHQQILAGIGRGQFLGLGDRALHALGAGRQHQLRAERHQHLAPLHAHGIRHGEHAAVAARRSREGQRNAGVAAGGLDDGHSGLQCAALLGVPHHRGADAALHRVGGIAALDLGEDGRAAAGVETVDADQRRMADGLGIVLKNRHVAPR